MNEPIIRLENVTVRYGEGTPFALTALDNINLDIPAGCVCGIIGHTGSGKSTLAQLLNGLLQPTGGKVLFKGEDINRSKQSVNDIRFKVGLVFQYPEYQLFEETVEKDIAFGPKNMGLSDDEIKERVIDAMRLVNLSFDYLDKSPFELSGGEKRKVAIAGVMAMRPQVLVLDEPTAGLDPKGRNDVLNQIKRYHKESGSTVILVSHSMEDIAKVARRVLVMNHGEVMMFDKTENVFKHCRELTEIGLDVPQVTKIFMSLKEKGIVEDDGVYTVERATEILTELLKKRRNANA